MTVKHTVAVITVLLLLPLPGAARYDGRRSIMGHTSLPSNGVAARCEFELPLRGGGATQRQATAAAPTPTSATRNEQGLQATALLFALSGAMTALSPAPHLIDRYGAEQAMALLASLAGGSALLEILVSPLWGSLLDSVGRKPMLMATIVLIVASHALVAAVPATPLIAAAKFVDLLVFSLFILCAQTAQADLFRDEPKRLAAASGAMWALINGGFAIGIQLSAFLPQGLRLRYSASAAVGLGAAGVVALAMSETLAPTLRKPFEAKGAAKALLNPVSFTRLLRERKMRVLTILLALHFAPIFMGDLLQVYASDQWGLDQSQVVQLFAVISLSGVVANSASGPFIRWLGVRHFTTWATLSNLLFWAGLVHSRRVWLIMAVIGVMGSARTLGPLSIVAQVAAGQGIPLGQLSGDRANLIAILKVFCPVAYGAMYVNGKRAGLPALPYLVNCGLMVAAAALGHFALSPKFIAGGGADSKGQRTNRGKARE